MPSEFDVIVIGAGFAGLYSVHKMRDDLGLRVKGFDAAGGPGGTWWWNRYPGARCDIESVHYSFSFSDEIQRGWQWTERFASQPEILAYIEYAADKLDVRKEFTFNSRVVSVTWHDETRRWSVMTDSGELHTARFVIAASGNLSLPVHPEFPGIDDFAGEIYMTSRWPAEPVDFAGKRVGVIGTGSTGIQVIQTIAPLVGHLTVFQRTPGYAAPLNNEPVTPEEGRWFSENHDKVRAGSRKHPMGTPYDLPHPSSHAATENERRTRYESMYNAGGLRLIGCSYADIFTDQAANNFLADYIREQIRRRVNDPKLAELLSPTDHPYGTRRPPLEIGYYEVFNRDNVELVDVRANPITRVTQAGIQTSGDDYRLDMIILATGFDALTGPLLRLGIIGRNGVSLSEHWADGPRTYLGIAMSGFPNLFSITGPTSAVALYNNPLAIEDHVEFAADAIRRCLAVGADMIEPTAEAESRWHGIVDGLMQMTLFPKARSWYMGSNVKGKPRATSIFVAPAPLYHAFTNSVRLSDFGGFRIGDHAESVPAMMKLDPQMANVVGIAIIEGIKPLENCTVEETRAIVSQSSQLQGRVRDVQVFEATYPAGNGCDQLARIYVPHARRFRPVMVFYHGGGFIAGNLDAFDKTCRGFAEDLDMVVVAAAYRLAPEHLFPAATDDTFAALRWAADVSRNYGGDSARLVVAGESAGANLAAVAAQRARNGKGPILAAQILITPAIDALAETRSRVEFAAAPVLSTAAADKLWQHYLGDLANAHSPLASPNRADTLDGLPPTLIITAECDPLRDEGEEYGEALARAGIDVAVRRLSGLTHSSLNMGGVLPRSRDYTDAMSAFLQQTLTVQALEYSSA